MEKWKCISSFKKPFLTIWIFQLKIPYRLSLSTSTQSQILPNLNDSTGGFRTAFGYENRQPSAH